jgi:hypothetical protein
VIETLVGREPTGIAAPAALLAVSMGVTVLEIALVTYVVAPSGVIATPQG